ncbi:hypothetical protein [Streptomyces platensis]|uniref:hypothetical protein n=1 Tax=Streptomyces platensis TaxID=58346 RepID=UPI0033279677
MATRTIGPRTARPVVPIRNQTDESLREYAVAFARLVKAAVATAPAGELGEPAANNTIADPATGATVGGGNLPDHVVRTMTRVLNEAADRLELVDDLTAVMDAVFPAITPAVQRPQLVALAGGAR